MKIPLFIGALVLIGSLLPTRSPAYSTRYVHVIIIDGARYTETFGDSTHQYIPDIWNKLRPLGTINTRFYNDSITLTAPAHASIVSGIWHNVPNDGTVFPWSPTIFEYARKELQWPMSDNYVILGKDKLASIAYSSYPEYGQRFGATVRYSVAPFDDSLTWKNIRETFIKDHPRITITNLAQVDVWGHTGIWEEYVRSIRTADSIVNMTWDLIQGDSLYKDKTTLIVTNDHGRHDSTAWPGHGCGCDGCRHLMFLMLGPDTRAGEVDTVRRSLIDIAPTTGELLDFSTNRCEGMSIVPRRPPATPKPVTPANDAQNESVDLSLVWNLVPRADHYHVQLSTIPTFDYMIVNDSMLTWNSRSIGPLELKTAYYWRIRARNSGGPGAWSGTRTFTTVPTLPPIVLLTRPENASVVSVDSVRFLWNTQSTEVDRFGLEIALDSLMTKKLLVDTSISASSLTFKGTKNRVVLWWRVKAHYILGWAPWSATRRFILDIPVMTKPPERFSLSVNGGYSRRSPIVLRYSLPAASTVAVRIFTLGGRYVTTLVDRWHSPDFYRVEVPSHMLPRGFCVLEFKSGRFRKTQQLFRY
jgi:hypothetical protein